MKINLAAIGLVCVGVGLLGSWKIIDTILTDLDTQPQTFNVVGAGASFPAPLYQRWFSELNKENPALQVTYQSVGSGAGVEQFTNELVDFGASDVAMTDAEMAEVERGTLLLPMTAGSVVLAYNLPGVEALNLSRKVYIDLMLGKITNWNDPAIAAINPDITLPDLPIFFVHRSDGSGTTGVFTKHLSAISEEWKTKVGAGKTVDWPVGIGSKGNEGVTATISSTTGAIGYIEYGYAKLQGLHMAALENKEGGYIFPSASSATMALSQTTLPENLRAFIPDPDGKYAYPIVSYSWLLLYKEYSDADTIDALKETIMWALEDGQDYAEELGYIPLPQTVKGKVHGKLNQIQHIDYPLLKGGN